jgi:hypothetical protein
MDALKQFLYNIAYKFPKGYPDINDPKDILILENELKKIGIDLNELETYQNHWQDRVKERGTILDITNFPKDYPMSKQEVSQQIQDELNLRSNRLLKLKEFPLSIPNDVGYKLMKPILIHENNRIPLKLKVEYTTKIGKKINIGTSYIAVISDNILRTLLLLNEDDDATIESNMANHQERNKTKKPIRTSTAPDYEFIITPKTEITKTLIDPKSLPYRIKTSYRVGSDFVHNDYGTGRVVTAASAGTRSGEPDSRGMVEWVEVDFGRPYVTGGVLKKTRIIKNVYTSLSPDIDAGAAE